MSSGAAPAELLYSDDDLWVEAEGDPRRVGVTDYAQDQLGEIVYLELPEPGVRIDAGEAFGVVESAKAVIDLISPVSGVVRGCNANAAAEPSLVNEHPDGAGWLLSVAARAPLPAALMAAATYLALRAQG